MKLANMLVLDLEITAPNGKTFAYHNGVMTYNKVSGSSFTEIIANPTLDDDDRRLLKSLSDEQECDHD